MVCYKSNIITVNKNDDIFKYLIVDKKKIIYVGNDLPEEYKNIEIVDLSDKAICPTFCDTHQHFASFAMFNAGLNVMDATSNEQIKLMIKDYVKTAKGKLLIAFGASPYSVKERVLLSKKEIDEVCPNKPMMIVKYDGHACIVNSALLKKIDKKVRDLRGYHPETGEMNQEAFFAVSDYISSSLSLIAMLKGMKKAIDFEARNGISMIHSVSGVGFPLNIDITLEKLFGKSLQRGMQLRIFPQSMNIGVAKKRHLKRIGGCFECALDGCFGSQDAKLNEPYINNKDNDGVLYYSDKKVIDFCKKANRAGLQIEMHAIGDKAFDQATKCLKEALNDYPRNDHRHGIIHDCLPTDKGIEICSKYHIQMPVQSAFISWKQEPDEYLESILGKERCSRLNPLRTFCDKGIIISAGSDGPCTNPNPIDWIYKAVNHSNPNEALTLNEAIRMCTYNGFWTTFDEQTYGSLEVGKSASFVILNTNPFDMEKSMLNKLNVQNVFIDGKEYVDQKQSILRILFKGIFSKHKI